MRHALNTECRAIGALKPLHRSIKQADKGWAQIGWQALLFNRKALVLAGDSDESVFMVRVINMSLSDGNKILTLKVEPLEYYDGVLLNLFNEKKQEIDF